VGAGGGRRLRCGGRWGGGGKCGLQSVCRAPVPRVFFRDSAGDGRSGVGAEGGVRASASRFEPRKSCSSERGVEARPGGGGQRQLVAAAGSAAQAPPAGWLAVVPPAPGVTGLAGAGLLPGWRAIRGPLLD